MKNIDIINRLSKKSDELIQIINHIKTNGEISQLYIDLCSSKLREMYEVLLIKTPETDTVEDLAGTEIEQKPVDNTKAQTEFDGELENLNFYQESENEDYSDIPITGNDELDVLPKEDSGIKNEPEEKPDEQLAEEIIEPVTIENMQEHQPKAETETETQSVSESVIEAKPEPTLFTSDDHIEEQEVDGNTTDINPQAEPNIKELVKDMQSQKESIGEKYMENNKKSLNDLLSEIKKEKDLATQMQYQPISDLKAVISLNDKIRFIKELFNSDNTMYTNIIEAINNCNDLDGAMAVINENIIWDESKESFKEFLELVYRRHLPENY